MKWNVRSSIGKNQFFFFFVLYSFLFSLKKVQEKKKQIRAIQEKNRAKLIEDGLLTGQEEDAPNILDQEHDEDVLF
jgi:hypothetical protein